ncbi:hypothetical protein ACFSC6_21140 [Rufibacter sediminis]|uniref:Uncharacterized protein n=1 Tax=Rufibacter sediminis TaxID=2762756 RepID=A0ABR6VRL0_9BACT|nr:hypothetical protein [Rufibacter sediminis]MBC3539785.1 hypothetical protein [Rufibacter sediminis]
MTHKDLVEIAYKWVLKEAGCAIAFRDFVSVEQSELYPDVIGVGSFAKSVSVKVDVSKPYYLKSINKEIWLNPEKGMGRFRFLCVPKDLVQPADLPANWGLIYVNDKGQATCVHNPYGTGSSDIWKNGFEDYNLYTYLDLNEQLNSVCRRFRYRAIVYDKQG